jgi:hypothetical protein
MLTHVKKNSFLALALVLTSHFGLAQGAPPAGGGAPALPPGPGAAPTAVPSNSATEIDSSTSTALDYLFNHKAGEGTTMKAGNEVAGALADKIKAIDVLKTPGLDNPEVKARFETYLNLKEVPQARIDEYFNKMTQVSAMLKQGDAFGAWKLLYSLGEYKDLDAGISRELAARVENFWNTDRTKNGLEMANNKLRSDIDIANHNADLDAQDLAYEQQGKKPGALTSGTDAGPSSGNSTNSTTVNIDPTAAEAASLPTLGSNLQGRMEMTTEYLNMLEARAKIKLNEIRENKMSDQDRMDFADYITTLYKTHRYYHVIIAADFYRALFNEGDYPSDLANQVVAGAGGNARQAADSAHLAIKSLGIDASGPASAINQAGNVAAGDALGQSSENEAPTSMADQVTSALEINNRVSQAAEVFKYKADKGEIANSAGILQDAFIANEFHPALQGLSRDEKAKVDDYLAKIDVLKNQLEVRDFEQVEGQVAAIQKVATDFDSTKPMALVNAVKLESRLRLGRARLLAQAGQLNDAMQDFQTAAEEWPGNPDLNTSANTFFKTENNQNQASDDFDRLVKDQNYREIFDRQLEFALAVKGDAAREQALTDALGKVVKAKTAEETANAQILNGDVDGAWETVELAAKEWPDDTKLNKLLADLSGRSADFVSALNKARDAEAKKELGYSLTWYVNAQGYYPPSKIANEGIDRLSKMILSPGASAQASGTN